MGHPRDSDRRRAWRVWVSQRLDALIRSGVPDFVYNDEFRWFRFVGHEGIDQETGWSVDLLSLEQVSALRNLLEDEKEPFEYRDLIRILTKVLAC